MFEETETSFYRMILYWVTTLAMAIGIGYLAGYVIGNVTFKPWTQTDGGGNSVVSFVNGIIIISKFLIVIGTITCCVLYNIFVADKNEYKYFNFIVSPLASIATAISLEIVLLVICWIIKAAIIIIGVLFILTLAIFGSKSND